MRSILPIIELQVDDLEIVMLLLLANNDKKSDSFQRDLNEIKIVNSVLMPLQFCDDAYCPWTCLYTIH